MAVLPGSLALVTIPDGALATAADLRNNFTAIQTENNSVLTALGAGTTGDVLFGNGTTVTFAKPPGYEYAYAERTTSMTTTQTVQASADVLLTAAAVTFDGATKIRAEVYVFEVFNSSAANYTSILLFEDGSARASVGRVASPLTTQGTTFSGALEFTPASGSRTYSVRVIVSSGTGTFNAAGGTGGAVAPAYIRLVKV